MNEENRVASGRAELEAQVAAHPFLIGMSEHHIHLLADCAMRSHFEAGHVIFREGEPANRCYLIERGKVSLESSTLGEPVKIEEIGDGDLLGWSWLFPPYAWHFTARAWCTPPRSSFMGRFSESTLRRITLLVSNC